MKKYVFLTIVASLFAIVAATFVYQSQANSDLTFNSVEEYQEYKKYQSAQNRYAIAHDLLLQAEDNKIKQAALEDILQFSASLGKEHEALRAAESFVRKLSSGSETGRQVRLVQARLLRRAGDTEQGNAIFQQALQENWNGAEEHYRQSLLETQDYEEGFAFEFQEYVSQEGNKDLYPLLKVMGQYKLNNNNTSVIADLFPLLQNNQTQPQVLKAIEALGYMVDGQYPDAIQKLQELEASQNSDKNTPLYFALVRIIQGNDREIAQENIKEYIRRNSDNLIWAVSRVLNICRYIQDNPIPMERLLDVASPLVGNDLLGNENIKAEFPDELVAAVYNTYQMGLAHSGKYDEWATVCLKIMENYFPSTPAGAHAALWYAIIGLKSNSKISESDALLEQILESAPYDEVIPFVKYRLAQSKFSRLKFDEASQLLQEVTDYIDTFAPRQFQLVKEKANRMKTEIEAIFSGESKNARILRHLR
jgi:tetratricopeptide (TPR) repeat protein